MNKEKYVFMKGRLSEASAEKAGLLRPIAYARASHIIIRSYYESLWGRRVILTSPFLQFFRPC